MSSNEDNIIVLNIILLGDSSVGKTSLLKKYIDDVFEETYMSTIGVDFKEKKISLNDLKVNLKIWDSAGQERFKSIAKTFIKGADGIMFVYDITHSETLDNLKSWIIQSEDSTEKSKIIIGNKGDKEDNRQVSEDSLKNFCEAQKIKGIEVSAKLGTNVKVAFETLVQLIFEGKTKEDIINKYGKGNLKKVKLRNVRNKKKRCCRYSN